MSSRPSAVSSDQILSLMSVMPSFIDRDISEVSLYVVLLNGTALGIVLNIESKPLFSGSELSFSISFFLASSKPGASEV